MPTRAHVPVIGDVELFAREIRPDAAQPGTAPVIAITGTNGKSTTTALIGHILASCGFDAQIGGNIGKSVLELAPPGAKTIYVLEMSSFQIDLTPGLQPDVARALQSHARPYRPSRHAWRTTPPSRRGCCARRAQGRPGRDRRRRSVMPPRSSPRLSANGGATAHAGLGRQGAGPRHLRGRRRAL